MPKEKENAENIDIDTDNDNSFDNISSLILDLNLEPMDFLSHQRKNQRLIMMMHSSHQQAQVANRKKNQA